MDFPGLHFEPIVSCLLTGHYWENLGSILLIFPFRHLNVLITFPWVFHSPGWTVPALSPHVRCSYPFVALCSSCCSVPLSLFYWRVWSQFFFTRTEYRGRITSLHLMTTFFLIQQGCSLQGCIIDSHSTSLVLLLIVSWLSFFLFMRAVVTTGMTL